MCISLTNQEKTWTQGCHWKTTFIWFR